MNKRTITNMNDSNETNSNLLFKNKYFYQCEWHATDERGNLIIENKLQIKSTVDDMVKTVFDNEDFSWFESNSPATRIYDCLNNSQPQILEKTKQYHKLLREGEGHEQIKQYKELKSLIEKTTKHLITEIIEKYY